MLTNWKRFKSSHKSESLDITKIRQKHAQEQASERYTCFVGESFGCYTNTFRISNLRKADIEKMEAEIRKLARRRDGNDSDDEPSKKKAKKSYWQEEIAKYSKGRGVSKKGKKKDEGDVLAALNSFRGKLKSSTFDSTNDADEDAGEAGGEKSELPAGDEDPGIEVDNDRGFLSHALHFPKDNGEESKKAERDYEVIDPRERGAKAKEQEMERKRAMKSRGGGTRYRR